MKPRTVTALVCAAALGSPALSHNAGAAPVEQRRIATTDFVMTLGAGATLSVSLRLSAGASGTVLSVATTRCDDDGCDYPVDYLGPVSGAAVSATAVSASLKAVVGGRSVALSWVPSSRQAVVIEGAHGSGDGGDDAVSVSHGAPADVAARVDDSTCRGAGSVGDEVYATDSTGQPAGVRPLTSLRLPQRGTLTC